MCLQSELGQVKTAVQRIMVFLDSSAPRMSPDDKTDLKLVFSELLINAVIHGNNSDSHKHVHLTAEIKNETLYSSIKDEGPGFDYERLIGGLDEADIFDENGRGVQIARSLTDSLGYNRRGNRIYFYKRMVQ